MSCSIENSLWAGVSLNLSAIDLRGKKGPLWEERAFFCGKARGAVDELSVSEQEPSPRSV